MLAKLKYLQFNNCSSKASDTIPVSIFDDNLKAEVHIGSKGESLYAVNRESN